MQRSASLALLFFAVVAMSVLLTGCGPEKPNADDKALQEETIRIAEAFVVERDAGQARSRLQALGVANPMQWLVFATESAISEGQNPDATRALADLALSLGSQSHMILVYGVETGLLGMQDGQEESIALNEAGPVVQPAEAEPSTAPTVEVIELEPTATEVVLSPTDTPAAAPALPEPTATATPIPIPQAVASTTINVRGGPGVVYPVVGDLASGDNAEIMARNDGADWWQVKLDGDLLGWVFGQLVETSGDTASVSVAANIPEPPPTPAPPPAAEVAEEPILPPAAEPAKEPDSPPPADDGPDFRMIERRLWDVYENGGSLNGPSVTCGEKRQLVVNVVDANGVRLNGVAVQAEFGAKEIFVTGSQGKGDGVVEFVLGEGQDVKVIRDVDGRDVTSDIARGLVTKPAGISYEELIGARYCTDDASCKSFVDAPGCWGHYSWTVTFQRKY